MTYASIAQKYFYFWAFCAPLVNQGEIILNGQIGGVWRG
jgi:hypothetical protein